MGREFDPKAPGMNTFSVSFLRKKYHVSWNKVVKILSFFTEKGRIILTEVDDNRLPSVGLKCLKLEQLCDSYTDKLLKQLRTKSVQTPDQEGEEEGEEEDTIDPTLLSEAHLPDAFQLCLEMRKSVITRDPQAKCPESFNSKTGWGQSARLLLTNDKRPLDEVLNVLNFAVTDEFWSANILSVTKLRKNYSTLVIARRKKLHGHKTPAPKPAVINPAAEFDTSLAKAVDALWSVRNDEAKFAAMKARVAKGTVKHGVNRDNQTVLQAAEEMIAFRIKSGAK